MQLRRRSRMGGRCEKRFINSNGKIDSKESTVYDTFLKYKNGGYYNTEESDGKILGLFTIPDIV